MATKKIKPSIKKPKRALTHKQKKVVELMVEDGRTKGEILKEAGYSEAIQIAPSKVFGSKAIIQAFEDGGLTDDYLMKKHKEHLNAKKIEYKEFYSYSHEEYDEDPEGVREQLQYDLETDIPGAKVQSISKIGEKGVRVRYSLPDYVVQDRSLDKAYKVKGSYAPDKVEHSGDISLLSLFQK